MSGWELALQLGLLALLGAAFPFAMRLERQLAALRQDRKALEGSAAGFQEATRLAEAALVRLRAATELAGRQVAERVAAAEPLRDDLRYLAERAEGIADRLDMLVRSARPLAAEPVRLAGGNPSAPPTSDRADQSIGSQAERDLLHALRRQR